MEKGDFVDEITKLKKQDSKGIVAAAIDSLSLVQLHFCPERNEWSANAVLAHLSQCSGVWESYIMNWKVL